MNIKEFPERKRQLDNDIRAAVAALISEFNEETGLCVKTIDIQMIDASTVAGEDYRIARCYTEIAGLA